MTRAELVIWFWSVLGLPVIIVALLLGWFPSPVIRSLYNLETLGREHNAIMVQICQYLNAQQPGSCLSPIVFDGDEQQ